MLEMRRKEPDTIPDIDTLDPGWAFNFNLPEEKTLVKTWSKASWKNYMVRQQPNWPDYSKVENAVKTLSALPPLVPVHEIITLKKNLALACEGKAFVLQGGDCSEKFLDNTNTKIERTCKTLAKMAFIISVASGRPLIKIGRLAGQFAKPRSSDTETVNGINYPSYRGDIVNDASLNLEARRPDPGRILQGYAMAQKTLGHLKTIKSRVYTSHEALLLPYEDGLLRQDDFNDQWYLSSGHMLWIGERTRQLDSAHIELMRGVTNPMGIKVGPDHSPEEISELCKILNPDNEAGRLSLITRFGRDSIDELLPPLVREIKACGHRVVWITDPMHGNTFTSKSGYKTRKYEDIISEIRSFFRIHAQEKTIAGGVHLEMTGENVTECVGGNCNICDTDLHTKYMTSCDPRLNEKQSLELAFDIAGILNYAL